MYVSAQKKRRKVLGGRKRWSDGFRQKAQDVAERYAEDCIVIGADTVVACDQEILGKPADDQDAFRMLHMLQGRTHEVYTGVTIVEGSLDSGKTTVFAEKTEDV